MTNNTQLGTDDECPRDCGVLACLLYLRVQDLQATYGSLRQCIAVTASGTTLAAMQRGMTRLGHSLMTLQCPPEKLTLLRVPFIAHLDRTASAPHYVVVLDVTDHQVRFADPVSRNIVVWPDDVFALLTSGYVLAAARPEPNWFAQAIWASAGLWLAIAAVALGRIHRRTRCCTSCVLLLLVAQSLIGCNRASTSLQVETGELAATIEALDVPESTIDLGFKELGAPATAVFKVANRSDVPITIELVGKSCRCLDIDLEKPKTLPPNASGTLSLALDLQNRLNAGNVEGEAVVRVRETAETHTLTLKATVDGVSRIGPTYAIRSRNLQSGQIPPLRLAVLTRDRDTPFHIDSIDPETQAGPTSVVQSELNAGETTPSSFLEFLLHDATVSSADLRSPDLYVREITVPVRLLKPAASICGDLIVAYRLGDESRRQARFPFFVVARE